MSDPQEAAMQAIVVAMEYRGADIAVSGGVPRVPTREHAYDLQSATLIGHLPDESLRVAFPSRQRGWNSPPEAERCTACEAAVQSVVRAVVRATLATLNTPLRKDKT